MKNPLLGGKSLLFYEFAKIFCDFLTFWQANFWQKYDELTIRKRGNSAVFPNAFVEKFSKALQNCLGGGRSNFCLDFSESIDSYDEHFNGNSPFFGVGEDLQRLIVK